MPHTNDVIEQFRYFAPPKFKGKEGLIATEEWVLELERIFNHIECIELQKISCVNFHFAENGDHW